MKKKYDVKKVSRETLEKLAEEVIRSKEIGAGSCALSLIDGTQPSMVRNIFKEAEVPLRTKAQVDADIAVLVRKQYAYAEKAGYNLFYFAVTAQSNPLKSIESRVIDLLNEETSD